VKHYDFERGQIRELAEIRSCGLEDIAEEASDRHKLVRMWSTTDAHLEEHARADQSSRVASGRIGDLVGAVPTGFCSAGRCVSAVK
jgi:hypothetical protein